MDTNPQEIDLAHIEEVDPEFAIELRRSMEFKRSEYGRMVASKLKEMLVDAEKSTVSLLCMGDTDGAKTAAGLAAAAERCEGILWGDNLQIARDITARKEEE